MIKNEYGIEPPPKKRRFQCERLESCFVFRERTQRTLGMTLLAIATVVFLLPGFFLAEPFFFYSISVYGFLFFLLFILFLIFSRMEYTLDSNGLKKESHILFFKFVKQIPLHEIQSIDYHVYPKGLRSVDVTTDCEVLSIYNSNNVSVSEEECRWLAGAMQKLLLELKRSVKNDVQEEISRPSKTRWIVRREFDRLEIISRPPSIARPVLLLTFLCVLFCIGTGIFWLRLLDIIPADTPEESRLTWNGAGLLVLPTLISALLLCCFFSAWREALTWTHWTFTEREILKHFSYFLPPRRFEIQLPCQAVIRNSTSVKPIYRRIFGVKGSSMWPNVDFFGDQELVIHDTATDRTVILGAMTAAEAVWLRDVLHREKLVHWQ